MERFFKLERPNTSQISNKRIIQSIVLEPEKLTQLIQKTSQPVYLYWDKLKYKKLSEEFSHEELWTAIKFVRRVQSAKSAIKAEGGSYFAWFSLPGLEEFFHQIDLNTGGNLFAFAKDINEKEKYRFISRGIVEEAIASSQLEGANTTRKLAKKFLQEGRKPRTEAEQMILNNYRTMKAIEEEYRHKKMDLNSIFELHSMIVENTVPKEEQGKFRKDEDNIVISDEKFIYHRPPKIAFVEEQIETLIKFANDELGEPFIHPVIKAIMLHFWLGYLHPFTNGNGRLARLLFYWYLLKRGYWAFAYLPISKIIRKSPSQYKYAYVYSEQDDLDLTYFIDYNIRKIKLALKDFERYLNEKSLENKRMNKLCHTKYSLNDRQIQLIQYYYDNRDEYTSPKAHMNIYQISKKTAINDLKDLEKLGFVISKKVGKHIYYYVTDKIEELFSQM